MSRFVHSLFRFVYIGYVDLIDIIIIIMIIIIVIIIIIIIIYLLLIDEIGYNSREPELF